MSKFIPAFTKPEQQVAHIALASRVASMMGRKFEEGDWSQVYCVAKRIRESGWSNLSIDVIHGHLGIEHKMICARNDQPIKGVCGTSIMHPAGTRSIRIPAIADATEAAQNIIGQYADLISTRRRFIYCLDAFNHGLITREQAIDELIEIYPDMKRGTAVKIIPANPSPLVEGMKDRRSAELRTGWLIWKDALDEFLYFEEETSVLPPEEYYAEWVDSGGGRRKRSRNLWVYERASDKKKFSITTEAGAKIQPYFDVPAPNDPALFYFKTQGEVLDNGLVRLWLTEMTAGFLQHILGSLDTETLSDTIKELCEGDVLEEEPITERSFGAVPITITPQAYSLLCSYFTGVSDDHRIQLMIRKIKNRPTRR